jgi:hypothetical protein
VAVRTFYGRREMMDIQDMETKDFRMVQNVFNGVLYLIEALFGECNTLCPGTKAHTAYFALNSLALEFYDYENQKDLEERITKANEHQESDS